MKRKQQGFSLMMAMVTIALVAGMTVAYFDRSSLVKRVGGSMRDSNLAQALAEAGAARISGQFQAGAFIPCDPLDTPCVSQGMPSNLDLSSSQLYADTNPGDSNRKSDLYYGSFADLTAQDLGAPELGYWFYAPVGNGATPIVQRVATGEGAGGVTGKLTTQVVSASVKSMHVEDLFVSGTVKPLLFIQTSVGGLAASNKTWQTEPSTRKVAVWFELEQQVDAAGSPVIDIYCAAAAQYDRAKSYVRQYVGTF